MQTGFFTTVDGELVMVTGTRAGTGRLWDLWTGAPLLSPLVQRTPGFVSLATSVATGVVDGQPVMVSASRAGPAKRWNARTGECCLGADGGGPASSAPSPLAIMIGSESTVEITGRSTEMVLPVLSPVNSVFVVDGGLAIGTASSLLVIDVPGLHPLPPAPGGGE